jgi:hypothetical protein
VNFLIHNFFTHLGGCALLWKKFCFVSFPYDGWILYLLSTLDLKIYEVRRGQTSKIHFERKDMILV